MVSAITNAIRFETNLGNVSAAGLTFASGLDEAGRRVVDIPSVLLPAVGDLMACGWLKQMPTEVPAEAPTEPTEPSTEMPTEPTEPPTEPTEPLIEASVPEQGEPPVSSENPVWRGVIDLADGVDAGEASLAGQALRIRSGAQRKAEGEGDPVAGPVAGPVAEPVEAPAEPAQAPTRGKAKGKGGPGPHRG